MTKQKDHIARLSALTLVGGVVFFCWWVILKNFPVSHQIVASVPFDADRSMISQFEPSSCIEPHESGPIILCDEVRFSVRSPRWFEHARLVVTYSGDRQLRGARVSTRSNPATETLVPLGDYELTDGKRQTVWSIDVREIQSSDSMLVFSLLTEGETTQRMQFHEATITLQY